MARPRIDPTDQSVGVQVRLPSRKYDALYQRAHRERVTVQDVMRRALDRELRQDERDEDE